jgi:hypothetical protein
MGYGTDGLTFNTCTLTARNDHHQPQSIEAILWGAFAEP